MHDVHTRLKTRPSTMPSPVHQCREAFRRSLAVMHSATRLDISWFAVLFPAQVTAIARPFGGMPQTEA